MSQTLLPTKSQVENHQVSAKKGSRKTEVTYRKLTMGFNNYRDIKQAHLKNRLNEESQQYQQNKECTFQPNASSTKKNSNNKSKRSLKKFLEDQEKFSQEKKQKIDRIKQQKARNQSSGYTGRPIIDSVSHRISTQMSTQKVFERLSKEKKMTHEIFQEQMFSPKICHKSQTLRRQKDVASLLYDDAVRRRQKNQMDFEELLKKEFRPEINPNTNQLVIRKFYSEFTEMVVQKQITPLLAITVLSEIFNIDLNPNKNKDQEQLCEKVLYYIADTQTEMVRAEVLWNFIQTVVNGHLVGSTFTEEEEQQILLNFGHFYSSRLTRQQNKKTVQQLNFQPKTLKKSQKLAQKHRQRTLSSINQYLQKQKINIDIANNSVRIEDLFIIERMKKNAQNESRRLKQEEKQLEACSFKPDLRLSAKQTKQGEKKKKINVAVPKTTKALQIQKKFKIKQQQQQEIDKENDRLKTMYQNSSKRNLLNSTLRSRQKSSSCKPEVRSIEKSVMRITLARKNKELRDALQQRGYPKNIENWEDYRKSLKKQVERSSEKFLKGYQFVQKSQSTDKLRFSVLAQSKQLLDKN